MQETNWPGWRGVLYMDAWCRLAGKPEIFGSTSAAHNSPTGAVKRSYDDVRRTQWDDSFERLVRQRADDMHINIQQHLDTLFDYMRGKLIFGYYRYHKPTQPANQGLRNPKYNMKHSLRVRTDLFISTNNLESIADAANFALLTYVNYKHTSGEQTTVPELIAVDIQKFDGDKLPEHTIEFYKSLLSAYVDHILGDDVVNSTLLVEFIIVCAVALKLFSDTPGYEYVVVDGKDAVHSIKH